MQATHVGLGWGFHSRKRAAHASTSSSLNRCSSYFPDCTRSPYPPSFQSDSARPSSARKLAASVTPRAGTLANLGQLNVPVSCGDVVIRSGDMIAGDEDGVVAIPARELKKTLALAREIENKEFFIKAAIARGLSLQEASEEYKSSRK